MTTSTMGVWHAATRRLIDEPEFSALVARARTIQAEQERRDGVPRSHANRERETAAIAVYLDHYGEIS
jgi:hypothetical protein